MSWFARHAGVGSPDFGRLPGLFGTGPGAGGHVEPASALQGADQRIRGVGTQALGIYDVDNLGDVGQRVASALL